MAGRGRWLPEDGGGIWSGAADKGRDDSPEAHLGGEGKPRTEAWSTAPARQPPGLLFPLLSHLPRQLLTAHHSGQGVLTLRRSSSCSAFAAVKHERIHVRTREMNKSCTKTLLFFQIGSVKLKHLHGTGSCRGWRSRSASRRWFGSIWMGESFRNFHRK